jgi:hypothetical protein
MCRYQLLFSFVTNIEGHVSGITINSYLETDTLWKLYFVSCLQFSLLEVIQGDTKIDNLEVYWVYRVLLWIEKMK